MEEDIKILEEFKKNGYSMLYMKYGDRTKTNLKLERALENLINGYRKLEKEIKILREYIIIAPNLDEMTALKYAHIQESAYFRGRAEEQQRANETIHKHFIPKSKIKEKILNPMKEEHDKAITGFMKRDIPQCIEDGGIAQVLGCFIGKIEELMGD